MRFLIFFSSLSLPLSFSPLSPFLLQSIYCSSPGIQDDSSLADELLGGPLELLSYTTEHVSSAPFSSSRHKAEEEKTASNSSSRAGAGAGAEGYHQHQSSSSPPLPRGSAYRATGIQDFNVDRVPSVGELLGVFPSVLKVTMLYMHIRIVFII